MQQKVFYTLLRVANYLLPAAGLLLIDTVTDKISKLVLEHS